jgi:polar amino acid transport system substrate-binding protein
MMIATMSDTRNGRKIVDIIEPNYYGSGTNILALKTAGIKSWDGLRGQEGVPDPGRVLQQGAAGKIWRRRRRVPGTAEALAALKNGNCVAFAYDTRRSSARCRNPSGARTKCRSDSILFVPWGLAVKQGEKGFADMMSKTATGMA